MVRRSLAALCFSGVLCAAQSAGPPVSTDSDHDGLTDGVESVLLESFRPSFFISSTDCSERPASFLPGLTSPTVAAEDGTIYGQVFPRTSSVPSDSAAQIEIHYYHLWRNDCGELGHRLDAEHVSVLLAGGSVQTGEGWKAAYWYAASHEDTLCDASQVARAATLNAEQHGPQVWISAGKHASYLSERLCRYGCGGDRCEQSQELPTRPVVNLGEPNEPMNGAVWLHSSQWPLASKMVRSDFTGQRLARVEHLPVGDVAWANPARRPAQAAILGANAGIGGTAIGAQAAGTALHKANDSTGGALKTSTRATGRALSKSYHAVTRTLGGDRQSTDKNEKIPAKP